MKGSEILGWITAIFGIIVLIGAIAACPSKHASVSVSIFMILVGLCFATLARERRTSGRR